MFSLRLYRDITLQMFTPGQTQLLMKLISVSTFFEQTDYSRLVGSNLR